MAKTIKEIKDGFNAHLGGENPHEVTSKQIWGLHKADNTADAAKPVTKAMQAELDKKMDVSDIYNSTEEDSTKDLAKLPWSAAQGYSMNNVINTYQAQDTSDLERRIAWCEEHV